MSNIKICAKCSFENKAESKFCEGCGATLETTSTPSLSMETVIAHEAVAGGTKFSICPSCGSNNPAGSKFCDQCGSTLPSSAKDAWYEQALVEIEGKQVVKSIWARAFVEANGDLPKVEASYIKLRVEQLESEVRVQTISVRKETANKVPSQPTPEESLEMLFNCAQEQPGKLLPCIKILLARYSYKISYISGDSRPYSVQDPSKKVTEFSRKDLLLFLKNIVKADERDNLDSVCPSRAKPLNHLDPLCLNCEAAFRDPQGWKPIRT